MAKAAGKTLEAPGTGAAPAFHGNLAEYAGAGKVSFEGRPLAGHPRQATVYTLWDAKNLYLAFDVHSSKLRAVVREHDGDKLWEDDGIEFLVDAGLHRTKQFLPDDFSYHINILNTVYDDRGTPGGQPDPKWNGAARHAVTILDDYHYIVEVAVPWSEIGLRPKLGTRLGIDFCVNGKDPSTGEYDYFDWCGLKVFHDPSGFGELVLAGRHDH
jgi:cellulose/xylan binding protein with CBM9 domain